MKTKRIKILALLMLVFVVSLTNQLTVYAQVDEKEAESIITRIIEKDDANKEEEIEVRYPNKLTAKEPPKDTNRNGMTTDADTKRNKGIASDPSKVTATLTENVDNKNSDYPIYRGSDEEKKPNKYVADARQFISFKTKYGKTFHLIINHDENTENVMLLTEVSEDDLLNFVEAKGKKEEPVKEVLPKEEPVVEVKPKEKEKEKSDFGTYLLIFIVGIGVLSVGYYFKVIKRKEEEELKDFENEESDEEYYSEYEGDHEEQGDENETEEVQNQSEAKDEVEYEDINEEDLV